jgi:hypothetical protein
MRVRAEKKRKSELSPRIVRVIDRERARLGRATAVLKCLTVASIYDDKIDVSDVVEVAYRLVLKAIDHLDSIELLRAAEK